MRPFPKPGPRCDRRQRKQVKSRILTDSPIKNRIEQETLSKAAVKKKYCKGAKTIEIKCSRKILQKTISSSSEFD